MHEMNTGLIGKFQRLQRLLGRRHIRNYAESGRLADATFGQGRILAALKMKDGVSTRDLSYLLGVRVSSLNELLAKMEKNGYITREQSEDDRRVILVKLTEKGRDEKQGARDFDDVFACLSDEEQIVFGGYLDRVIAGLESELGSFDGEDGRGWPPHGEVFGHFSQARREGFPPGGFGPHGFHRGPHGRHGMPGKDPCESSEEFFRESFEE